MSTFVFYCTTILLRFSDAEFIYSQKDGRKWLLVMDNSLNKMFSFLIIFKVLILSPQSNYYRQRTSRCLHFALAPTTNRCWGRSRQLRAPSAELTSRTALFGRRSYLPGYGISDDSSNDCSVWNAAHIFHTETEPRWCVFSCVAANESIGQKPCCKWCICTAWPWCVYVGVVRGLTFGWTPSGRKCTRTVCLRCAFACVARLRLFGWTFSGISNIGMVLVWCEPSDCDLIVLWKFRIPRRTPENNNKYRINQIKLYYSSKLQEHFWIRHFTV